MQTQHGTMMEMLREANQLAEARRYAKFAGQMASVHNYAKLLVKAEETLFMIDMIIANTEG